MEFPEVERCRRTGTPNWRCPERAIPGKIYCQKHFLYSIRRKSTRITFSDGKCDSLPSAAVVEPYRPVIDFGAVDVGGGGGTVESFVEEGEMMGWLLGNDRFALHEAGVGGGLEVSDGVVLGGGWRNDDFAPVGFRGGNKGVFTGTVSVDVCENQEYSVERNDVKCGESRSGKELIGISGENKGVCLGRGDEGQNGKVGCAENVIVIAMEAKSGLAGGGKMVGQGQKRKRSQSFGSKTTTKMTLNGE